MGWRREGRTDSIYSWGRLSSALCRAIRLPSTPGEPAEKKTAKDVQRIMYMLNQQQDSNAESHQQRNPPVASAGEAEI